MRRFAFRLAVAVLTFILGVMSGAFWYARRGNTNGQLLKPPEAAREQSAIEQKEEERPLTAPLVSRALQTRTISTKRLPRNGNDDVVWRWLKKSIGEYPQAWPSLEIKESEHYFIVIYRAEVLDPISLKHRNAELKARKLPLLKAGKRYAILQVNEANTECPSWTGLIDLEDAKLAYFEGHSA